MSDKIGVLGSSTTATGTVTAYTVPAAKAAKCRLMYNIQGNADATTDLQIKVNGQIVMDHANITASNYLFSSPNALKEGPLAALPTGVDGDTTGAPAPIDYYLAEGDTVVYIIGGTAAVSMDFQVVGSEIDV